MASQLTSEQDPRDSNDQVGVEAAKQQLDRRPTADVSEVSTAPFQSLRRITIADISTDGHTKGTYLLARTIKPPRFLGGIATKIEDHTGNLCDFSVFNFLDDDVFSKMNDFLPLGSIFILKEPFLLSDTIFCTNPTDMIVLFKYHKLYHLAEKVQWKNKIGTEDERDPTSSEGWKALGNERFKKEMFYKSIEAYLMALGCLETSNTTLMLNLYSNLSVAYTKLQYHETALSYAKRVLELDPKNTKSLFLAGQAHYRLRQYEEAHELFENLVKIENKNIFRQELSKCSSRLEEREGNVNIYKLFLASVLKPGTEIDCADYTGPVKVTTIPGKGRGFVATEPIKPGTLLIVSKAIVAHFHGKETSVPDGDFGPNSMLPKLMQMIMKNPNVYGGLVLNLSTSEGNVVSELFCDGEAREELAIETEHVRKIIATNCNQIVDAETFENRGSGLFCSHSLFNHDCLFNAWLDTYGDVMVIHAVKSIECGEEVTITYNNVTASFLDRESNNKARKFQCCCSLCELERKESKNMHARIRSIEKLCDIIYSEYKSCLKSAKAITEMSNLISELKGIYAQMKRQHLRYSLCTPHTRLAAIYLNSLEPVKAMSELEIALNAIGLCTQDLFKFHDHGIPLPKGYLFTTRLMDIPQLAALSCLCTARKADAKKWLQVLLSLEKMSSGGNIQMLRRKYKNVAFGELESALTKE